jgi:hypothetical protein
MKSDILPDNYLSEIMPHYSKIITKEDINGGCRYSERFRFNKNEKDKNKVKDKLNHLIIGKVMNIAGEYLNENEIEDEFEIGLIDETKQRESWYWGGTSPEVRNTKDEYVPLPVDIFFDFSISIIIKPKKGKLNFNSMESFNNMAI